MYSKPSRIEIFELTENKSIVGSYSLLRSLLRCFCLHLYAHNKSHLRLVTYIIHYHPLYNVNVRLSCYLVLTKTNYRD